MNNKTSVDAIDRSTAKEAPNMVTAGVNAQSRIAVEHFKRTTLPRILNDVEMRKKSNKRLGRTGSLGNLVADI